MLKIIKFLPTTQIGCVVRLLSLRYCLKLNYSIHKKLQLYLFIQKAFVYLQNLNFIQGEQLNLIKQVSLFSNAVRHAYMQFS